MNTAYRFLVPGLFTVALAAAWWAGGQPASADALDDCRQVKNLEKSIAGCDRVISRWTRASRKTRALAHERRGNAYYLKGDYPRALADAESAIKLNSKDAWAYQLRASVSFNLGKLELAEVDFGNAIRLDSSIAYFWRSRGHTFMRMGKYDEALSDLNRAISLDPKNARNFDLRANLFEVLGRYRDALNDYKAANSLDPSLEIPDELRRFGEQE